MRLKKKDSEKLDLWRERLRRAKESYQTELDRMERRHNLYKGTREVDKYAGSDYKGKVKRASVRRNIVAEIIEAQVSSDIPRPKVTARHQEYEELARLVEDWLRGELDRLPMEVINDQDERTTPVQGGDIYLVEWDNERHTHQTAGEISIELLHPKQVIPQQGATEIADMDYVFVRMAQTKEYIKAKYGVDVYDEKEDEPGARGFGESTADGMVTQDIVYYRNKRGGIGRFSWVGDKILEDMEDYQARRLKYCEKCGQIMRGESCEYCGWTKAEERTVESETLFEDIRRSGGDISAVTEKEKPVQLDEYGNQYGGGMEQVQTQLPYYIPDCYPLVLRRNVSAFGSFLGDSDVDKIEDQQMSINKTASKIEEKILGGGSFVTLPAGVNVETTDREFKVVRIKDLPDKAAIDVFTMQPDISKDLQWHEQSYQSARNIIGITDSFQGRYDSSAISGTAKQFSAAQAAGRLESKRTMKNFSYSELFKLMFKFFLAYADEPRSVKRKADDGSEQYDTISRYDFLEQDAAGEWYWLADEFLFSVDTSAPLASNREAMWKETRENLTSGAFGDPSDLKTLIRFWAKMDMLHYPGAKETKQQLERDYQEQQQAMQMMQQAGQYAQTTGFGASLGAPVPMAQTTATENYSTMA